MTKQFGSHRTGPSNLTMLPSHITVILGLFIALVLMPTPASALATYIVNNAGVGIACPGSSGLSTDTTVQAAVSAALADPDPDVVVEICPGTYLGHVTVIGGATKNLTIRGLGAVSPTPPSLPDKTMVQITGTGGATPIVDVVSAASVNISNLTVDGQSLLTGDPAVGIRYGLVPGVISNVMVQNIRNAAGTIPGIGILALGQDMMMFDPMNPPTEVLLQIHQCMVMNATHAAIMADGQGINVRAEEVQLIGPNAPLDQAPNGFQVSRGAKGMILNSDIFDFKSPLPTVGASSGILFLCPAVNAGGVAVAESNRVRRSDIGVALVDSDGVRVASNTIIDTEIGITMQSQGISFPSTAVCFPPLVPTQNSQIVSNLILDATEAGVQAASFSNTPGNPLLGEVPRMNNVEDNRITTDIMIGMAPIAVSSGENNSFLMNIIFVGPTSGIVDFGTDNTFSNFCVPPAACTPSAENALLPPKRPAFPCLLPARPPLSSTPTPTPTVTPGPSPTPTMMFIATATPTPTMMPGDDDDDDQAPVDTIPTLDWRGLALLIGLLLLFGVMALRRLQT